MRSCLYLCPQRNNTSLDAELHLEGWRLQHCASLEQAQQLISQFDLKVGIIHLDHTPMESLSGLGQLIFHHNKMEWIAVLTPNTTLESSLYSKFIVGNFFDFHSLPVDHERLRISLGHAYGKALLKSQLAVGSQRDFDKFMLGESPAMQALQQIMTKVSYVDTPVLICGESGTGKELVAQLIHNHSARGKAPFIPVNCGALPEHLIQSELFGHEKGSFTGAIERKIGKIEMAQSGTIFLDEIGDLPLLLQTNLLRFLQEKIIERVGSRQSISINARVIAATNVNLEEALQQGTFREDLYYRLNVIKINIPPLRDRKGDIPLLAKAFLDKFSRECNPQVKGFTQQTLRVMSQYSWPGNVRELINRMESAVVMTNKTMLSPKDLGLEKRLSSRNVMRLKHTRELAEKEAVRNCLLANQNNISQAARQLGVSRVTLYRLMDKLQVNT